MSRFYTVGGYHKTFAGEGFCLHLDPTTHLPFVSSSALTLYREHHRLSHVYRLSQNFKWARLEVVSEHAENAGVGTVEKVKLEKRDRKKVEESIHEQRRYC